MHFVESTFHPRKAQVILLQKGTEDLCGFTEGYSIPTIASARGLSCIRSRPEAPGVPSWAASGTKDPSFTPSGGLQ
jgi:hypothetical protein